MLFYAVKLIGKLEDGTVFVKKGHDGEEPFEFKTDEGNNFITLRRFAFSWLSLQCGSY